MSTRLPASPDTEHFAAPLCRNCDVPLHGPWCAQCGQKRAQRLGARSLGAEVWQSWRWFELALAKGALSLVRGPGTVAREYVLGARSRHVHPLKLLLAAIAILLLVLAEARYLDSANEHVSRAMAMVRDYGKWSFSLGIVAIALASNVAFFRHGGFNRTEHLVLAAYTHFLVICASIVNLLPTLLIRSPEFLRAHKAAASWYMGAVDVVIVLVAFAQFFRIDWRRDAWRLLLAAVVFLLAKWALLRLYAWLLLKYVLQQLAAPT
ncbi:MAG: DUF3667 domain-containing protein [Xanthomonadales bacterium]|nr:MAG: DUF3667 domain-containing protein [Dokdonella sp.]MBC6943801.1 DUF3667 domain-containing protein [Xanthomonadales bacterium]MDL1870558.1 DUF3667 domain-containing protein [Gammaproteobacteria bacterium PRO6]